MSEKRSLKEVRCSKTILTSLLIVICIWDGASLRISHQNTGNTDQHLSGGQSVQHGQAQVYDEQQYLVTLAETQNDFKDQITEIQNGFAGINMMINDQNLPQSEKNIKLNEALADEREALITAQQGLNIPYELKSCECLNLTEQKKLDLKAQLDRVSEKIQKLEESSEQSNAHCEPHECPLMEEVNAQIAMMKSYQQIMKDTISSQCCRVVKYEYRDNLNANNWHWGNTTQSQYQAEIMQREVEDQVKLQPCPQSMPYVLLEDNTCYNCPEDMLLFNLGKRQCEKDCAESSGNEMYVLNLTTHTCGYNRNCPEGQQFEEVYMKCVPTPNYYNESSCPPATPFWDPSTLSCQSCPSETPYYDAELRNCRSCQEGEVWNENDRVCESATKCGPGYVYSQGLGRCVIKKTDTHSICPPTKPYWNENTLSCDKCPEDMPYFDPQQTKCRQCRDGETFNPATSECASQSEGKNCAEGQFYNELSKECQPKGTTSMCPPTTPYWDSENLKCTKCPPEFPLFNERTKQCEPCPLSYIWSAKYQSCIQECSENEEWSVEDQKCLKTDRSCPEKQAFSVQENECVEINCSAQQPYWNSETSECEACPEGTTYNYNLNTCVSDNRSGNVSVCHEDKPVWNAEALRCEECPQGKSWDSDLRACVEASTLSHKLSASKQPKHFSIFVSQMNSQHQSASKAHGRVYGNEHVSFQFRDLKY